MNKIQVILLVFAALVGGGVIGGYSVYKVQSNNYAKQIAEMETKVAPTGVEREVTPAKKAGHGMTPDQMVDELLLVPKGEEFDWRYLNYLQVFKSNETAMSRLASERATEPELRAAASEQMKLSNELSSQLFQWRAVWGFTDH